MDCYRHDINKWEVVRKREIMKRKLRIICMCAGLVFFIAFFCGNIDVNAKSVKSTYKTYFKNRNGKVKVEYMNGYDYDKNMCGKWKTKKKIFPLSMFTTYKIKDINGDKKPELLLSTRKTPYSMEDYVMICTYKKGKVVPVFCVGGLRGGIYTAKKNQICFIFGGSDCANMVFLKLKGTKLVRKTSYTRYTIKDRVPYRKIYYKNKKRVKEAVYIKYMKCLKKQIVF